MSKAFKNSHLSAGNKFTQQRTPNYSIAGNPMSSYTGQQFSHMHQSLDAEEIMDPIYDDDAILIKDGIKMSDPSNHR
jgi:hypothetical protein